MNSHGSKSEYTNPAYDDSKNTPWQDDEDCVDFCESEFDQTIDDMEYQLDDIVRLEANKSLNLSELNRGKVIEDQLMAKWRQGPAPTGDQIEKIGNKLATLEGSTGENYENSDIFWQIFNAHQWDATSCDSLTNTTASNTLVNYFSYLGTTGNLGEVDYEFLDMLIKVADINSVDKYGQSIMHEVAREWHTDVARYLKIRGVNIDIVDNFGRTPLFVAVSSNHTSMVRWLIQNGADINHRTIEGEGQHAIHFAAKHSAMEAFDVLVKLGVSPIERDDKDRTPFFVAAERGQQSMCECLLELELPVASYASSGVSTIDHVISKLPTRLAFKALDQFIADDQNNDKEKYFLSCLGKRRWKLLTNFSHMATTGDPPTPLEIIVERNDLNLIMHPIILKYIEVMSMKFGARYTNINISLCVLFTVLWTLAIVIYDRQQPFSLDQPRVDAKIALTVFGQLLSVYFIQKFVKEYLLARKHRKMEKQRLLSDSMRKQAFAHPRWSVEDALLKKQREVAARLAIDFWSDGWNYVEGLCLLMSCLLTLLTILLAAMPHNEYLSKFLLYYSSSFSLVVWIRLNRCLRSHQVLGPFIAMLAECVTAVTRFAFLFFEFYVPFTCAFWVLFGGSRKGKYSEYTYFNDLIYQMFLMTIVGDYEYDTLKEQNKIFSQILVGLYFILSSIITLNLFIALLSEAFERVRRKAAAGTFLLQAKDYIDFQREHSMVYRDFESYINKHASPMLLERKAFAKYKRSLEIKSSRRKFTDIAKLIQSLIAQMENIQTNHKKIVEFLGTCEQKFRVFNSKYNPLHLSNVSSALAALVKTPSYYLDKTAFQNLVDNFQTLRDKNMKRVKFLKKKRRRAGNNSATGGFHDDDDDSDEDIEFEEFKFKAEQ